MKDLDKSILVFIHVKKTGGISLQWLLAKQYGAKFYGGHTHSALKKVAAVNPVKKNQIHSLPDGSCICKHWSFEDFSSLKDRANFITIARHPTSRIVSHYNFYRKHFPKGQTFREYIQDPANINLYTRFLPRDLSLLTEVLPFEDLAGSVSRSKIINASRALPHTNKTPYKHVLIELELFKKLNADDLYLYEQLKERFI